jgi:hypothetical protein
VNHGRQYGQKDFWPQEGAKILKIENAFSGSADPLGPALVATRMLFAAGFRKIGGRSLRRRSNDAE